MSKIVETNDIPQADLIWDVARVPEAVELGMTTPGAIADYLGNKVSRQGLYYAQAAYTLGLVTRKAENGDLTLTTYGQTFMSYNRTSKQQALRRLVIETEPIRSIINGLCQTDGLNRDGIARLIQNLVPLSYSTACRRAQTISLWLCTLGLAVKQKGLLVYIGPTSLSAEIEERVAA